MRSVDTWAFGCQWRRLKGISVDVMTHHRYRYHKTLVTGHSMKVRWKYHRAKSRNAQMITRRAKNLYTDLKVNERRESTRTGGVHMRDQGNYALKTSTSGTLGHIEDNLGLPSSG